MRSGRVVPPEERLANYLKGSEKRTCPKCDKVFVTRKQKRIHQKNAHKKYT